jgi:DNA-binding IclR family transcriptional regulator
MVADTSRDAFRDHRDSGALGAQQLQLVRFLARHCSHDWTRSEIATVSGMRLSSVCGRVNELVAVGVVEELPRRRCTVTGRSAHAVRLSTAQGELSLEAA